MEPIDEHFLRTVEDFRAPDEPHPVDDALAARLEALFDAQAESRHLDFAARWLQQRGAGFYTISSAGHESNAAVGLLSRTTDPALLHYRSGAFYAARAHLAGGVDPVRETLRGLTCSTSDPISGGRHKVFGHAGLHIVPQTSTIASHLPRAVGLGFALGLAKALGRETPWPEDALVVASFGDASVNHSTAAGALNAAAYLTHVHRDCPLLLVCEDNGLGISTRTPRGWPAAVLRHLPGIAYFKAAGHDTTGLLETTEGALEDVRTRRSPAVLHLSTVRFMGHAGSDVEIAYRIAGGDPGRLRPRPVARHRPRAGRERPLQRGCCPGALRAGPAAGPRPVGRGQRGTAAREPRRGDGAAGVPAATDRNHVASASNRGR